MVTGDSPKGLKEGLTLAWRGPVVKKPDHHLKLHVFIDNIYIFACYLQPVE